MTIAPDKAAQHEHDVQWSISPFEDKPKGAWIRVELVIRCGCELHAVNGGTPEDDFRHFGQFAAEMRDQHGWNIAATSGWGSHTTINPSSGHRKTVHTVKVRRKSLTEAHNTQH